MSELIFGSDLFEEVDRLHRQMASVFSGLPFQSTRHALSLFCSPIHKPSCVAVIAFG